MIVELDGGTAGAVDAAKQRFAVLAGSWGHELTEGPTTTQRQGGPARRDDKVFDPVSLIALVVSLPSAALAVVDLADRIRKRRRAQELIDNARQVAGQQVSVYLISRHRRVEITALGPDQLLDLLAEDDTAT